VQKMILKLKGSMLLIAHQIAISSIVRLSEKPTDDSIRVVVSVNSSST
jgi:hypothetical protein